MENSKYYYVIVTFNDYNEYQRYQDRHVWACFYEQFVNANNALKYNLNDQFDTIYKYGVIEGYNLNKINNNVQKWFYKYNKEKDSYEPININEIL